MPRTIDQLQASVRRHDLEAVRYRAAAASARREDGDSHYAEELEDVAELHNKWAFEDEAELSERQFELEEAVA